MVTPPRVASTHGRPPKIGRYARCRAEVVVEEISCRVRGLTRGHVARVAVDHGRRLHRRRLAGGEEERTGRAADLLAGCGRRDHGAAGAAAFSVTRVQNLTSVRTGLTVTRLPLMRLTLLVVTFFLVIVSLACVGMCRTACVSTLPAAFGVPLPGLYGVQSDVQRKSPAATGCVIAETEKVAESSLAPNCARPGVPAGTSGGGRQMTSLHV